MAKMSDREILKLVDSEFQTAMGAPGGEISVERAKNWDYYLSKPLGNEIEGESQVVTSDVSDVVDGIMPSLLRLFTIKENLVSFDAVGPEDEDKAQQESDYINYIFFKRNPAFDILYTWFFDALLQKNGIIKVWYDESEVVTTENYSNLTEEAVFEFFQDKELEAVERSETTEDGVTLHDITFKRTCKKGRFCVENVPPEEYRISNDAKCIDPSKARMVGQERELTRSELLGMGFDSDIVNALPKGDTDNNTEEKISRYNKSDETGDDTDDPSQDLIKVREAYVKLDYDRNGKSELRQIITAGGKVLSNEPADRQPFHVICPQPLPHKHFGRCPAEKVNDILEVNTTLLRQTLNNLYHSNNPSHGVSEFGLSENTIDDLLTTRGGSIKRFNGNPSEVYAPIVTPFTAQSSFGMMEYFDKMKRDRTGVNADSEGLSPEQLKNIQQSVLTQANDLSRMKIEAIARIFAETGIKSLFLHLHELVLKHQNKEEVVKLRNTWVEIDPRSWRTRYDMTVNIGLGIGSRESNLMHLNDIWDKQRQMIDGGGLDVTVNAQNIYNTASEIVKNANYKDAEVFFQDPAKAKPQEEQPDPNMQIQMQMLQLESEKIQLEREKLAVRNQELGQDRILENEKREDKLFVDMEKLKNQLTDMELKYEKNVPGSAV